MSTKARNRVNAYCRARLKLAAQARKLRPDLDFSQRVAVAHAWMQNPTKEGLKQWRLEQGEPGQKKGMLRRLLELIGFGGRPATPTTA